MIRAMLIDDERPALVGLEYMLKNYEAIQVVGMFTNPIESIEAIGDLKPDVVFLDIEMPQLRGIDAASAILEAYAPVEIIFVTAYQQYAIEAFEMNALDYLLKPVIPERLAKSISRIVAAKNSVPEKHVNALRIHCFGGFQMYWEGSEGIKWRAEKTKELFIYLLQNRHRQLSKDVLLEGLWPEDDPARAIKQLYNGIYYIRKNLQDYGIERSQIHIDSAYKLTIGKVWLDLERFNSLRLRIDTLDDGERMELEACLQEEYLKGEYYVWMDYEREHYNRLQELVALKLSERYRQLKQYHKAVEILTHTFNRNMYQEEVVKSLIRTYLCLNQSVNARRVYDLYKAVLKNEFGIEPSQEIKNLIV